MGDASVPFHFDIHAMMFSDDAPSLEHKLHEIFEEKRVNLVNRRKEFFKITLEDIEKKIKSLNVLKKNLQKISNQCKGDSNSNYSILNIYKFNCYV